MPRLSHPETFTVGDAERLSALAAEVHVAAPEKRLEIAVPNLTKGLRAVWTDWLDVVSFYKIHHLNLTFRHVTYHEVIGLHFSDAPSKIQMRR